LLLLLICYVTFSMSVNPKLRFFFSRSLSLSVSFCWARANKATSIFFHLCLFVSPSHFGTGSRSVYEPLITCPFRDIGLPLCGARERAPLWTVGHVLEGCSVPLSPHHETQWQLYVPPALTRNNSAFFPHGVFISVSYDSRYKRRLFA
jgi:hypothetical protein